MTNFNEPDEERLERNAPINIYIYKKKFGGGQNDRYFSWRMFDNSYGEVEIFSFFLFQF